MKDLSTELVVCQSNRLVEAAQSLTLNEKRLVLAAIALHDSREAVPFQSAVTLPAQDFARIFGLTENHAVYECMAAAARLLYERSIKTIYDSKGKIRESDVRWVWKAEYRNKEGCVVLGFSPAVAPYLGLLKSEFTRFRLGGASPLGTVYALRLYELCAQYREIGWRELELERLRAMLDLGDKYQDMDNLRRRVLAPALREINNSSDLCVGMEPKRAGRKTVGFRFTIRGARH